jgi:proteasome lid subunit RPN8/RPN11
MIIRISSGVIETLLREARSALPNECCGLVTGQPGLAEAAVPAKNVHPDPATGFEIDPKTLLATHRNVRAQGRDVIGHYHSHPNGRAEPSRRDAARAVQNGQIWFIIANDTVSGWEAVPPNAEDAALVHGRFAPLQLLPV